MANNDKLDIVMDFIRNNPDKHDQDEWVLCEGDGVWAGDDGCVTTACIAGWTAIILGKATKCDVDVCVVDGKRKSIHSVARGILELSSHEARILFFCDNAELETVVSDIKQGLYG